jgi:hypothetical protein
MRIPLYVCMYVCMCVCVCITFYMCMYVYMCSHDEDRGTHNDEEYKAKNLCVYACIYIYIMIIRVYMYIYIYMYDTATCKIVANLTARCETILGPLFLIPAAQLCKKRTLDADSTHPGVF